MISVASAVTDIVVENASIVQLIQEDLLNRSAYAQSILPAVSERVQKPVKLGTVVVALSRIANQLQQQDPICPSVVIDNFSVTSDLSEMTYDKTDTVMEEVAAINTRFIDNANAFFAMTMGVHEVTIICSESIRQKIAAEISTKAATILTEMVAVSVRFSSSYIEVPNTIFSLVSALAARRINLVEILSTYTELTFVIRARELDSTIQALHAYSSRLMTPERLHR